MSGFAANHYIKKRARDAFNCAFGRRLRLLRAFENSATADFAESSDL